MTSASTKRRHKRNAALVELWRDVPIGTRITVRRARGDVLKTTMLSRARLVDGAALVMVAGIPGNTRLERMSLGWNPEPTKAAPSNAEIQRLRAAMVRAKDDCESAADHKGNPVSMRTVLLNVARRLKAALETK